MITNRRSFLKKQILLGSSFIFASSVDGLAMITKNINNVNSNALNLLCTSNITKLGDYHRTIKNFETASINLFAGSIGNANYDTLYQLERVNYHAANFSLPVKDVDLTTIIAAINGSHVSFVNCNYIFEANTLKNAVLPYLIIYNGKTKIGITGIGATTNTKGVTVKEPIAALNKIAKHLKHNEACDKVICLADLGFDKRESLNNLTLAQASANVDVIIGAGINSQEATAWSYRNLDKQEVLVSANKQAQRTTNVMQLAINQHTTLFNTKNI